MKLADFFADLLLRLAGLLLAYARGHSDAENKNTVKVLKATEEANETRLKVDTDPEYRDRVRRMFDGQ